MRTNTCLVASTWRDTTGCRCSLVRQSSALACVRCLQVGFFDIVALPLFYSWASVFHEALPLVRAVEDNCNRWRSLEMGRNAGSK